MNPETITDEQLFFEALELPTPKRERFIEKSCAGDLERLDRIKELLRSHDRNGDNEFLLDCPVVPTCLPPTSLVEIGEKEGDRIGRYRLLERIGEGGMGVVYMADQTVGVRRRVALKIIKLGMDTRQVIARFEAERQAMALFDHPNIAKVLDIGATDSGRPYFVMELVKGTTLTDFVSQHQLDLEQRLELFIQVCNALQHAHQKGIIHRDLKPSNVLVTLYDGKPVPKVIDFGIAKAIGQQQLTDKTLFTRYSAMVGTPQYMSPEQAELTGMDVDTRSDIYSLGVLLYELVTGSTPIKSDQLASLNPLALYETLRDAEIETPSVRLTRTLQDESFPADAASVAIAAKMMKRELDWVILKALSRDRNQRYAAANELAADVQRFIDNEPVLAAPPSKSRWFSAFYRKNRSAVIAGGIVGSTMIVASIACFALAVNALNANRELNSVNLQLSDNVVRLTAADFDVDSERAATKNGVENEPKFIGVELIPIGCCTCYDPRRLLIFEDRDRLGNAIENLSDYFDKADEENRKRFEAQISAQSESEFGDIEQYLEDEGDHSSECLDMQEQVKAQLPIERVKFYRILVDEYRRSFGENDPHVAEALILLAACLEELGEVDTAESHVREAILTADEANKLIARKLLDRIKLKRRQLIKGM